jgi:hypothetical protein
MNEKRLLTFVVLVMILAGCGAPGAATQPSDAGQPPGESPATSTTEPPPDVSPLEWLAEAAFEAAQEGPPDIIPANLPEGFNAFDPDHMSAETPSGCAVQKSSVTFQHLVGGQVDDSVTVEIWSYDLQEGRAWHLDQIAAEEYTWEFWELDGQRITRYHTSSVDGRVWISGPYLIVIYSGLDTSEAAPWVDAFTSLYLVMFPPN